MKQIIQSLRGGQITIPAVFREKLGITADTMLHIELHRDELRVKPVQMATKAEETPWFTSLYDQFATVRKQAGKYKEKDINTAIDVAVKSVRSSHGHRRV